MQASSLRLTCGPSCVFAQLLNLGPRCGSRRGPSLGWGALPRTRDDHGPAISTPRLPSHRKWPADAEPSPRRASYPLCLAEVDNCAETRGRARTATAGVDTSRNGGIFPEANPTDFFCQPESRARAPQREPKIQPKRWLQLGAHTSDAFVSKELRSDTARIKNKLNRALLKKQQPPPHA